MKKAQSHVEMIISAVLFITFISLFFVLINPIQKTQDNPIDRIQKTFTDSITSEIGKLSVITATTNDCYSLTDVNDDYGNNFIEIKENPTKYTIYYNSIFTQNSISCSSQTGTDYTLGVYSKENLITENKIITLKQKYETNYNELKESLGIRRDFAFTLKTIQKTEIQELTPKNKIPPTGINVIAKEFPVRIIDNKGIIKERILNLRVW